MQLQSQNCEFATPHFENCLAANKTHHFDNNTLICRTVQVSASWASAAIAAGESEQRRAPPAPVPPLSRSYIRELYPNLCSAAFILECSAGRGRVCVCVFLASGYKMGYCNA
jgi:hypothetical protein